jgi:transposase
MSRRSRRDDRAGARRRDASAVRSRLEQVRKVAATVKRHLDGVPRFVKHPITNGVAEGLNSKIMSIKRKAGGFRNPGNFTTAIYFHCGGLDLCYTRADSGWFQRKSAGQVTRNASLTLQVGRR